jgi:hypothetical protein
MMVEDLSPFDRVDQSGSGFSRLCMMYVTGGVPDLRPYVKTMLTARNLAVAVHCRGIKGISDATPGLFILRSSFSFRLLFHQLAMHKFFVFFFACVLLFTIVSATPAPVVADVENRDSKLSLLLSTACSHRLFSVIGDITSVFGEATKGVASLGTVIATAGQFPSLCVRSSGTHGQCLLVGSAATAGASAIAGDHQGNAASALSASSILTMQFVTVMGAAFLGALLL